MIDRYEPIRPSIWTELRGLGDRPRLLAFYLRTGQYATVIPGLVGPAGPGAIGEDIDWPADEVRVALDELVAARVVRADQVARMIWFPVEVVRQPPANPGVVSFWARTWPLVPNCSIKADLRESLRRLVEPHLGKRINRAATLCSSFDELFPPVETVSRPSTEGQQTVTRPSSDHNQDQDQEHEQEHEQKHEQKHEHCARTDSVPAMVGPDVAAAPRRASRRRPATSLSEGWEPDVQAQTIAREAGLDLAREAESFRDHHTAKGSTFVDWDAAFRHWLRNATRFAAERASTRRGAIGAARARNDHGLGAMPFGEAGTKPPTRPRGPATPRNDHPTATELRDFGDE